MLVSVALARIEGEHLFIDSRISGGSKPRSRLISISSFPVAVSTCLLVCHSGSCCEWPAGSCLVYQEVGDHLPLERAFRESLSQLALDIYAVIWKIHSTMRCTPLNSRASATATTAYRTEHRSPPPRTAHRLRSLSTAHRHRNTAHRPRNPRSASAYFPPLTATEAVGGVGKRVDALR